MSLRSADRMGRTIQSAGKAGNELSRGLTRIRPDEPCPRHPSALAYGVTSGGSRRPSRCSRKIVSEMSDSLGAQDTKLTAWRGAMPPAPGPFKRLIRVILDLVDRRDIVAGYDEREPPPAGAGVPARPKRPAPTLLAAAELELPHDSR